MSSQRADRPLKGLYDEFTQGSFGTVFLKSNE